MTSGEVIGPITDLLHLPANDVLVVLTPLTPTGEVLIPFVKAVVPVVDVAAGMSWWTRPTACSSSRSMRIDVVTIFAEYLAPLRESLLGKAIGAGLIQLGVHDLRAFTTDRHRTVDDTPYGGGPGMVMKPDVWGRALDAVCTPRRTLIVPTPAGERFTQAVADRAGGRRPPGVRLRPVRGHRPAGPRRGRRPDDGPGAVHRRLRAGRRRGRGAGDGRGDRPADPGSAGQPGQRRPGQLRRRLARGCSRRRATPGRRRTVGSPVPPVLLSGNHAAIDAWRREQSLLRTRARRPDLLDGRSG